MPQSLSSILIHLVFSMKNREPLITPDVETELHPYMAKIFREQNSPSIIIGGTEDHIHALFALGRTIAIADLELPGPLAQALSFRAFGASDAHHCTRE